tara:strand:- start:151 stop:1008 length:858 start_codon:yes stop_codon:yes gene_type:complete
MIKFIYRYIPFFSFLLLLSSCESTESKIERLAIELKASETPLKNTILENGILLATHVETDQYGFAASLPRYFKLAFNNGNNLKVFYSTDSHGERSVNSMGGVISDSWSEISDASLCGFSACYGIDRFSDVDEESIYLTAARISEKNLTKLITSNSDISSLDDLNKHYYDEYCNNSLIIGIGKKVFTSVVYDYTEEDYYYLTDEKQIIKIKESIERLKDNLEKGEGDPEINTLELKHKTLLLNNWGKELPYIYGKISEYTFCQQIISEEDYTILYGQFKALIRQQN